MANIGDIQISDASEYGRESGFVVEQFVYGNSDEPHWCIPGWVEDQWGSDGHFPTRDEAEDFLAMVRG